VLTLEAGTMYLAPAPSTHPPTAALLARQVGSVAPDLDPESERWKVALLVLAVSRVPFNVDRLTAVAGVPRELAAKVARRLFDNGIAPDDVPDPVEAPWMHETFWNVVGVAEGALQRRTARGWVEWVPAGSVPRSPDDPEPYAPAAGHAAQSGALPELFPGTEWLT
jgi:hypothetical protein